jgi:hypothetical protein
MWAKKQIDFFTAKTTVEKMCQDVTNMAKCYHDADNDLQKEYDEFFANVANMTRGKYVKVPMKFPMRALEKTAYRYDEDRRWKCDNVYDVLRGAIVYPSMEGIKRGAEMICNRPEEFEALLLKDRFTEGNQTSSGWADALLNGRFTGFNTHVVEIQLHHAKLVSIRADMGGHYLYSIFRSLVEALEVVFGDKKAQAMIVEHSPTKLEADMAVESANKHKAELDKLQAEIEKQKAQNGGPQADMAAEIANKHNAEIDELQAVIVKQKAQIGRLQSDKKASKLTAEIVELQAELAKQRAEKGKLQADIKKLQESNAAEIGELQTELAKQRAEKGKLQADSKKLQESNVKDEWQKSRTLFDQAKAVRCLCLAFGSVVLV